MSKKESELLVFTPHDVFDEMVAERDGVLRMSPVAVPRFITEQYLRQLSEEYVPDHQGCVKSIMQATKFPHEVCERAVANYMLRNDVWAFTKIPMFAWLCCMLNKLAVKHRLLQGWSKLMGDTLVRLEKGFIYDTKPTGIAVDNITVRLHTIVDLYNTPEQRIVVMNTDSFRTHFTDVLLTRMNLAVTALIGHPTTRGVVYKQIMAAVIRYELDRLLYLEHEEYPMDALAYFEANTTTVSTPRSRLARGPVYDTTPTGLDHDTIDINLDVIQSVCKVPSREFGDTTPTELKGWFTEELLDNMNNLLRRVMAEGAPGTPSRCQVIAGIVTYEVLRMKAYTLGDNIPDALSLYQSGVRPSIVTLIESKPAKKPRTPIKVDVESFSAHSNKDIRVVSNDSKIRQVRNLNKKIYKVFNKLTESQLTKWLDEHIDYLNDGLKDINFRISKQ